MVVVTVGIDIGCESTKVVLGPSCEIVRNEVGGHTTPTVVAFLGRRRFIGDAASSSKGSPNAVIHLNRLLPGGMLLLKDDPFEPFYRFEIVNNNDDKKGGVVVSVEYDGTMRQFDSSAMLAMLLGKIHRHVKETHERIEGKQEGGDDDDTFEYVVALLPGSSQEAREAIRDAAFAASINNVRIVDTPFCTAAAYHRNKSDDGSSSVMLVVDMGHAQTTISVVRVNVPQPVLDDDTKDDEGTSSRSSSREPHEQPFQVLSSVSHSSLGAGSVDVRLWHHFQSSVPALQKDNNVTQSSKAGYRLLQACQKLKHLLSQLPDASVTVENIGDADVVLSASRSLLVKLCQPEEEALCQLLRRALQEAGTPSSSGSDSGGVDAIEVLGGGCRIPWVKSTILKTVNTVSSLSHSLDDTSVALGAAVLPNKRHDEMPLTKNDRRMQLRESERTMAALDEEMGKKAHARNLIESHILEMRAAKDGKHGSLLLPNAAELDAHLDQAEEWLFSSGDDNDDVTLDTIESKYASIVETTRELCGDYFRAIQQEAEAKEREIEEEAKRARLERNDEEEDADEGDHDTRRLPKKRRMEIVQKNKREANELFADGNYRHAAARYTKALTHCSKFVDLSPDDVDEVNAVKLSLNLNLALAYIKLDNTDQALRVCNDALAIDSQSAKALYRRACVYYEKKRWEDAKKDVCKAAEFAPDDKAIQKLRARIDLQVKKQEAKEKKMAQKMFG